MGQHYFDPIQWVYGKDDTSPVEIEASAPPAHPEVTGMWAWVELKYADGRDTSGPTTDDAMTRSEEELTVGKTERESGRVRLKKYVVEDEVTETVPVRREEVRVEREPITDANRGDALDGPDISEEEHEVTLRSEEPVVEKRTEIGRASCRERVSSVV